MTAESPTFVELLGRPLRLLVLCYEMPPIGGGTGVACSQVMRVLAQRPDLRIDVISSGTGKGAGNRPGSRGDTAPACRWASAI